jgi:hypothetical protein
MRNGTEIVNGQEVSEGWGEVLGTSQKHPTYLIDGRPFERIPYGEDQDGEPLPNPSCRDCTAAPGQFHVPGCCIERCPRCGGQAIGCGCFCPFTVEFSPFVPVDGEVQE